MNSFYFEKILNRMDKRIDIWLQDSWRSGSVLQLFRADYGSTPISKWLWLCAGLETMWAGSRPNRPI